ncbi:hypothetical protein Ancab_024439 [Ancistrocladus abbreviatus]
MDTLSRYPLPTVLMAILFTFFSLLLPYTHAVLDSSRNSTLVYKYCAIKKFSDCNGPYSRTRLTLFELLLRHSSQSKFYSTVVKGDNNKGLPLSGHFQCRGYLSDQECYDCVRVLSSNTFCADSAAARIQHTDCHLQYEFDGEEVPGPDVTYKSCGEAESIPNGFEETRNAAFEALKNGIESDIQGYYSVNYGSVFAMAQCEDGRGGSVCWECVNKAVDIAEEECGNSISGQVFMDVCFVSYEWSPNDGPNDFHPEKKKEEKKQISGKVVAIAVGGAALLAVAIVYFRSLKSSRNKNDDS